MKVVRAGFVYGKKEKKIRMSAGLVRTGATLEEVAEKTARVVDAIMKGALDQCRK